MTVHLGIDLGTTYSTVAAARNGRVELLSLGTRGAAVPSVVFVRDDGPPLVGEAAEARAQGDPSRFAREFKRRLGDPTPLILGGVPMGAERLSGYVLAHLVERATERIGETPASVVLTHPASYTQYRLDLLGEAVHLAGLDGARLLAEPRAAALHYASDNRVQDGETVAVYDFGGGTFDTALVRRRGDEFDLVGDPQGIDRFGGIDIDLAVFDYVCDEANDLLTEIDAEEPVNRAMLSRLRADCRLAKERLSADTETVVPVATPRGNRDVVVTRRLLESMIRFRLADTVQALERAVRTAGLDKADISRVLLVGGSSRIPLVRTLLAESFGRPVSVDADPESAIALGAAAAAARWATGSGSVPVGAAPPSAAPAAFAAPVVAAPATSSVLPSPSGPDAQQPATGDPSTEPTSAESAPTGAAAAPPTAASVLDPPSGQTPPPPAPTTTPTPPDPGPADGPSTARTGMVVPEPARPAPPGDIPPTPGSTPTPPKPGRSRRVLVGAIAGVVVLLVAAVVIFIATRSSPSDDSSGSDSSASRDTSISDTAGDTTSDTSSDTSSDTAVPDNSVQIGDDVGINPPGNFTFVPMSTSDLDVLRGLATVDGTEGHLDIVLGSTLEDAGSSTKGAVVRFASGSGDLGADAQSAIVDAILGEESVVDASKTQHSVDGVTGTDFAFDDGRAAWIAPLGGDVILVTTTTDNATDLHPILDDLAAANPDVIASGTSTTTASQTSGSPTTVAFNIDNVSFGDLNSVDPTINPPAGFHFEPLTDAQIDILRTSGNLVGPTATSLRTVVGSPLFPDGGSPPPGGIIMFLGNGTPEFQQQVATALITDGSAPVPFQVGGLAGTLFTRGDGTQGWVGPFHDSAILVSIDTVDPDHVALKAVLDGLAASNPA